MTSFFSTAVILLFSVLQLAPAPVAIVESVTGNASVRQPAETGSQPIRVYDWLRMDSQLSVGRGASIVLLFSNGSRWQFEENSTANLSMDGPTALRGHIQRLSSGPPLPRVSPIAGRTPPRAAAVRVRAQRIRGLYPFAGVSTIADKTVLRFSAFDGASSYEVAIQDDDGRTRFSTKTEATSVSVPPGILAPGTHYQWQVRSTTAIGSEARGEGAFETLSTESASRRTALQLATPKTGDAASLTLLAEIDLALNLLDESVEGLRSALAIRPNHDSVRAELQRVQKLVKDGEN